MDDRLSRDLQSMLLLYCGLGLKLGLVVRKGLAWKVRKLDGALTPRASLRLKVTQIGMAMFFSFGNTGS